MGQRQVSSCNETAVVGDHPIERGAIMMTCRSTTELVTSYLEGSLTWLEWCRFQFHLGGCGACRRYLRQMKVTIRSLGSVPPEPLPASVREQLHDWFQERPQRRTAACASSCEAGAAITARQRYR
jgi:predicted anti-sigma-YlaC factor YlaD